jgi:hypothetical protein
MLQVLSLSSVEVLVTDVVRPLGRTLDTALTDCAILVGAAVVFAEGLRFFTTWLLWFESIIISHFRAQTHLSGWAFLPGECFGFFRRAVRRIGLIVSVVVVAWTVARVRLAPDTLLVFEPVPSILTQLASVLRGYLSMSS